MATLANPYLDIHTSPDSPDQTSKGDSSANDTSVYDDDVTMVEDAIRAAKNTVLAWRKNCEDSDKMEAGWQWEPEDLMILRDLDRPVITFNRIAPIVNAVKGAEIHHRQEIRFVPRHPELGSGLGDLATESVKWVVENCNGDDERSRSFGDMLIRGMGWVEVRLSYDEEFDGKIILERWDGMEAWWDPGSRKQNLEDATWVARKKWMRKKDVFRVWPDSKEQIQQAQMIPTQDDEYPDFIETVSPIGYKEENQTVLPGGPPKGYLPITQFQYFQMEDFYRVVDDKNPDNLLEFSKSDFEVLRKRLLKLRRRIPDYVKQQKKVYYQIFLSGSVKLEKNKLPVQQGFTLKCLTGFWDPKERFWYGLVRAMKDPQQWANKWLSQGLYIVNSNTKGGYFIEVDAFENPRKAEKEMTDPSSLTLLRPGGVGKIKAKDMPQFPQAIADMMQYAVTSLREVTGINIELLGMGEGDQPGITNRQRQSQGMVILAPLFNALTRYRMEEARVLICFIRDYIADGRLIRVGGEFNAQSIPLLRDPLSVEYDIIVDENPKNPNTKAEVWQALVQLAPVLLKSGMFAPEFLDYSPIPASLVVKLKERFQQQQQQQQDPNKFLLMKGKSPEEIAARTEKLKADALYQVERAKQLDRESNWREAEMRLNLQTTQMDQQLKMAEQHNPLETAGKMTEIMKQVLEPKQKSNPMAGLMPGA